LDNDCTKTHLSIHCPGALLAISKSWVLSAWDLIYLQTLSFS